jgi:DNA topoisomerase III
MGKTLIIAEKPSVMNDLSKVLTKVLGKFEKEGSGRDVFYENDKAIITSAVGHLVELRMPMGPNGKKLPWINSTSIRFPIPRPASSKS